MSKSPCPFSGSLVALITPFRHGEVDYAALEALVDAQVAGGQKGLVPCGSTGESATLSHEEHARVVAAVVRRSAGRVPVIAGTGSNATREAIELTRAAEAAGADGALLISPYYNKPTQDGIVSHYQAVAESTRLPLIVYNIPGRTASTMENDTLVRLSEIDNIVAVKDSTGSLDRVMDVVASCGDRLAVLSGDDSLSLPMLALGARGAITVAANLLPREMASLIDAGLAGRWKEAREMHYRLLPLFRACSLETNPIPIKAAVAMAGGCRDELRLPLRPLAAAPRERLRAAMRGLGLTPREGSA